MTEEEEVVHRLVFGQARCRTIPGMPDQWPPGHRGSGYWYDVTCPACLEAIPGGPPPMVKP